MNAEPDLAPSFLPSLQCPSSQTALPVSATCLATSWHPHLVLGGGGPFLSPQTRTPKARCCLPSGGRWVQSVPFSQGSWRAEAMPSPPSGGKGLPKPQTRADTTDGTSARSERHFLMGCRGPGGPGLLWEEQALLSLAGGPGEGQSARPQSKALSKNPQGLGPEVSPDPAILNMAKGAKACDPGPHTRAAVRPQLLWARGWRGGSGSGMRSPRSLSFPG